MMKIKQYLKILGLTVWCSVHAAPVLEFPTGLGGPTVSAVDEIKPGSQVTVKYDNNRFYDIVDRALVGGQPYYYKGRGFAQRFHCYGYGCCDIKFPLVYLNYRFEDSSRFISVAMVQGESVTVKIPPTAKRLEVFFHIDQYHISTWYCGTSDQEALARMGRTHQNVKFQAYDSKFGQNFIWTLN